MEVLQSMHENSSIYRNGRFVVLSVFIYLFFHEAVSINFRYWFIHWIHNALFSLLLVCKFCLCGLVHTNFSNWSWFWVTFRYYSKLESETKETNLFTAWNWDPLVNFHCCLANCHPLLFPENKMSQERKIYTEIKLCIHTYKTVWGEGVTD
jgi:hypothetical protein